MNDQSSELDKINKRLGLAKNLLWAAGILFAGAIAIAGWTVSKWAELTADFVRYSDSVSLYATDQDETKFELGVSFSEPEGSPLRVKGAGYDLLVPYFRRTSREQEAALRLEKWIAE